MISCLIFTVMVETVVHWESSKLQFGQRTHIEDVIEGAVALCKLQLELILYSRSYGGHVKLSAFIQLATALCLFHLHNF